MRIDVVAPNRIDLAGGTTDLYPLYLFMEGGCTVNMAVTVNSRVEIRSAGSHGVRIVSNDLRKEASAANASDLPMGGALGLIGRSVRAFPPREPAEIVTENQAPAGSGLGASSALLVALIAGLLELRQEEKDLREIVDLATAIETANIGVPAGQQDYIAAAYGGISILEFGYSGFQRRTVPQESIMRGWLEESLILTYTGYGRFSGMNNWEVVKAFIDGKDQVREKLVRIRDIARQLGDAILDGDMDAIPGLVDQEWLIRRTLVTGVSTPQIDLLMAAAKQAGALANKVCGAGGGGCMITLARADKRREVEAAIKQAGGTILPIKIDQQGLRISLSRTEGRAP